jgi:alkanesulfonate monooxygenase SsuD/methylene tetrahydromethanopterin reductase-like flavin-dependent oxidoreductase (luciferase family)
VLGFSVGSIDELSPVLDAYKAEIGNAEPVGTFVNDNIMVTTAAFVAETADEAVASMVRSNPSYLQSNVYRYHDTFPHPDWVPYWPDVLPTVTEDIAKLAVGAKGSLIGDPDNALQGARDWEAAGADQLVFGIGMASKEDSLEMIRLMGEHVIPKVDTDPVHRTTRMREAAAG